jgi:hypothetical protein
MLFGLVFRSDRIFIWKLSKSYPTPVWLQAKGLHSFWIYSLPSPTVVTKKCKFNGITQSSTLELYHTGTLTEDAYCQFYSKALVLLPVSDGYTNVTITGSPILLPRLAELMSPQEHDQIIHEAGTHRTLAPWKALHGGVRLPSRSRMWNCGNCWPP